MTAAERQAEAALVLAALEPVANHGPQCVPPVCDPQCQVGVWSRHRAAALDDAGLLCALHEVTS